MCLEKVKMEGVREGGREVKRERWLRLEHRIT